MTITPEQLKAVKVAYAEIYSLMGDLNRVSRGPLIRRQVEAVKIPRLSHDIVCAAQLAGLPEEINNLDRVLFELESKVEALGSILENA